MNVRNQKLIEAAQSLFARYGVSKTTMNDIAREAGVARQTLYNAFPNKDEVLRAAIRVAAENTRTQIESAWAEQTTLSDKIETFCMLGPLAWYDMVQASPDAADLLDGIHTVAKDELDEYAKIWSQKFEELIRSHTPADSDAYRTAGDIAEFLYSTSMSAKSNAVDRDMLVNRLTILRKSVLALIEQ